MIFIATPPCWERYGDAIVSLIAHSHSPPVLNIFHSAEIFVVLQCVNTGRSEGTLTTLPSCSQRAAMRGTSARPRAGGCEREMRGPRR